MERQEDGALQERQEWKQWALAAVDLIAPGTAISLRVRNRKIRSYQLCSG